MNTRIMRHNSRAGVRKPIRNAENQVEAVSKLRLSPFAPRKGTDFHRVKGAKLVTNGCYSSPSIAMSFKLNGASTILTSLLITIFNFASAGISFWALTVKANLLPKAS